MKAETIIAAFSTLAVVAAIVVGFLSIGTPEHHREARLDERRAQDIQTLGHTILGHYNRTGNVIPSLQSYDLRRGNGDVYADPLTEAPYEYQIIDARKFEICANFETEGPHTIIRVQRTDFAIPGEPAQSGVSINGSGRQCFEFNLPQRAR